MTKITGRVFFLNESTTTEIYTLSLHDAFPILRPLPLCTPSFPGAPWSTRRSLVESDDVRSAPGWTRTANRPKRRSDRKSTRLNSSHANISYAVFCLKKKKTIHYAVKYKKRLIF